MELHEIMLKLEIKQQVIDIKSKKKDLTSRERETIALSGENDTLTK